MHFNDFVKKAHSFICWFCVHFRIAFLVGNFCFGVFSTFFLQKSEKWAIGFTFRLSDRLSVCSHENTSVIKKLLKNGKYLRNKKLLELSEPGILRLKNHRPWLPSKKMACAQEKITTPGLRPRKWLASKNQIYWMTLDDAVLRRWRRITLDDAGWRWITLDDADNVGCRWMRLDDVGWRWMTVWRWMTWMTLNDAGWRCMARMTLDDVEWRWMTLDDAGLPGCRWMTQMSTTNLMLIW